MIASPIVIKPSQEGSGFDVRYNDRTAYFLCWDEMIGQVIELSHKKLGVAHYRMETDEEHAAELERRETRDTATSST